jgi:hypothetical protein
METKVLMSQNVELSPLVAIGDGENRTVMATFLLGEDGLMPRGHGGMGV